MSLTRVPWILSVWLLVACFIGSTVQQATNKISTPFETLPYERIVRELEVLARTYPAYAQVYPAQGRYTLPSPGECGLEDCMQWVLHITDHDTLEDNPERPEVFFSGCLHGNEKIGPTAVLETARLMIYGAVCHANPSAKECKDVVLASSPESVPWLARLTNTRSTVFMPMTNALGYFNNRREEGGLDPNRDFPYQQDPQSCMTTVTARAVNEVWREHAFQLAVTFHGGMVAMAYEWGSPNHPHKKDSRGKWKDLSPDHEAQAELTAGLSRFAGGFKAGKQQFAAYPTGRMNELVYPVAGGMEDWAYAGSWDEGVVQCTPPTYGGYPTEKTTYNSATLRALNILVEASDEKSPSQETLGSRIGLLKNTPSTEANANGHVARNVRLSLMVVDLVEPYVQWTYPNFDKCIGESMAEEFGLMLLQFEHNLPNPSMNSRIRVYCGNVKKKHRTGFRSITVDADGGVDVEWNVGGAFKVDSTMLVWGSWPEDAETMSSEGWEALAANAAAGQQATPPLDGYAKWGGTKAMFKTKAEQETFSARASFTDNGDSRRGLEVEMSAAEGANGQGEPKELFGFLMAVAKVDQFWADQKNLEASPDVPPQSHFVNARTSSTWREVNNGHVVRGRLYWNSPPLKVKLAPSSDPGSATIREDDWGGGYWEGTVAPFEWVYGTKPPPAATKTQERSSREGFVSHAMFLVGLVSVFVLFVFVMATRGSSTLSRGTQGRTGARGGSIALGRLRQSGRHSTGRAGARSPPDSGRRRVSGSVETGGSGDEKNPFLSTIAEG